MFCTVQDLARSHTHPIITVPELSRKIEEFLRSYLKANQQRIVSKSSLKVFCLYPRCIQSQTEITNNDIQTLFRLSSLITLFDTLLGKCIFIRRTEASKKNKDVSKFFLSLIGLGKSSINLDSFIKSYTTRTLTAQ